MDAHEVAAERLAPARKIGSLQSTCEGGFHCLELWRQQLAMLCHQSFDAVVIAQEADMSQLIELVGSNRALRVSCYKPSNIRFRSSEQAETTSAEGYLGGRGKQ